MYVSYYLTLFQENGSCFFILTKVKVFPPWFLVRYSIRCLTNNVLYECTKSIYYVSYSYVRVYHVLIFYMYVCICMQDASSTRSIILSSLMLLSFRIFISSHLHHSFCRVIALCANVLFLTVPYRR